MGARKKQTGPITCTQDEYYYLRNLLRLLVRSREDFQSMRKSMDNRLGQKADGTEQDRENLTARAFSPADTEMIQGIGTDARAQEKQVEKNLLAVLRRMPVYVNWLHGVKGIGTISAAHICAAFDIYKADTVSKMWQYAGMNPGMVRGKKRIDNADNTFEAVLTDTMVKGDRLTPGFVSPFNKELRVALRGVMADGFIKSQNDYCMEYYYPMKTRLENSNELVMSGAGKTRELTPWRLVKPGHRDGAAKRYMVKMFLKDLYAAWRPMHGLPVREPYQEQYLGHKHKVA